MFDRYLAESAGVWRRRTLVVASLVAHALVGTFLFITTLFTVDEIRPPAIPLLFWHVPPPPPPPPTALGVMKPARTSVEKPRERRPPRVIVQPTEVKPPEMKPELEEKKEEEEEGEEGDPNGVVGGSREGVQGGVIGGVEGGQVGSTALPAPAPPPPPPPPPKVVASFIFDRERINFPDPHLTQEFIHTHPNQTVAGLYRICVDTEGKVKSMTTVSSISGMDDLIIQHVTNTWQWKPQPHPVCTVRQFKFIIN